MEFYISKARFLKNLSRVQGIVEKRNSLPILGNVLITSLGKELFFTATDLETTLISKEETEIVSQGSITLDAKHLYEIIRELPEEATIKITKNDNNWVLIEAGKATFNIAGLSSLDYPQVNHFDRDDIQRIELKLLEFKDCLDKAHFAMCTDESRYFMNGIHIAKSVTPGRLKAVSTDGHRLAIVESDCILENNIPNFEGVTVPKKSVNELRKILDEALQDHQTLYFYLKGNELTLLIGNVQLNINLIQAKFPEYERVIPVDNNNRLMINREQFINAVRRISILSNEKSKNINTEVVNNLIRLSAYNGDVGSAVEEVDASYTGDSISMGFNARYLLDALINLKGEEVEIKLGHNKKPIIIKNPDKDDYLNIIMPLKS